MRKKNQGYIPVNIVIVTAIIVIAILSALTMILAIRRATVVMILSVGIPNLILIISVMIGIQFYVLKPLKRIDTEVSRILTPSSADAGTFGKTEHKIREINDSIKGRLAPVLENEKKRKILLASICHDLRTPLTSLIGYVEALQDQIGDPQQNLQIVHERADFLNKLIDDLDVFFKNELDELSIYKEKLLAHELLKKAVLNLQDPKITLHEPVVKAYIVADAFRFVQVIDNVINNAQKHAVSSIDISTSVDDRYYSIRISDDGPGIASEYKTKIFDPFFRLKKNGNGTGLGLAIAKNLMEAHDGSIDLLDHETGKGAVFLIRFPIANPS